MSNQSENLAENIVNVHEEEQDPIIIGDVDAEENKSEALINKVFESKRKEVLAAVGSRLESALDNDVEGYTASYIELARMVIEIYQASISELLKTPDVSQDDPLIISLKHSLQETEAFIGFTALDSVTMGSYLTIEAEELRSGKGIDPLGELNGTIKLRPTMQGFPITDTSSLQAHLVI